jgi:TPR repeat protein
MLNTTSLARERILPAKEAPIVVAWDNPFPVFNPKKKDGKNKHASLDKEMSKMSMSDQVGQRPQTSQSHRRGDDSRPHTSQGHRRLDPALQSPALPSPHPMSPVNRPLAMRNDSSRTMPTQRNFSDGQAPIRPALNPLSPDRSAASFQGELPHRLQQPQRSMTMPEEVPSVNVKKKLQKNLAAPVNRQVSGNRAAAQDPYHYDPAPIHPAVYDPAPLPTQYAGKPVTSPRTAAQTALISPEMPNFDAISPSANEKTEDPLHVRTNDAKAAYQKAAYRAPNDSSPPKSQSQPNFPASPETQPDFGGFTFDLPSGANNGQYDQYQQKGKPSSPHHQSLRSPISPQNAPRSQSRTEQLPPRSASRQGYQQPRSASNVDRSASPDMEQGQYRSASDTQQYLPRNQSQTKNREPGYDDYQPGYGANAPPQGRQGDPSMGGYNQQPSQDTQRLYQEQRQYPAQINTRQGTFDERQPRGQTPTSAHPPPTRQYDVKSPSSTNQDALPAHPVPVRPGLLQNTSTASAPIIEGSKAPYQPPASNPSRAATAPIEDQADVESPVTAYDLNLLLQTIKNNPNDKKTALVLVKKLVDAAAVLSNEGGKADAKTTQKNREKYIFDAHKILKKLVHQGYPDAMFFLAECHGQGSLGLAVDPKEAFNLYTSAAKLGHAQAAYRVAVCCEMGSEEGGGTRRDPMKAIQWYKRAASMGDTPAMYKLGIILLKGLLGQPRNPREALSWLKRAAERADKENPHALHELGLLYENASPSDSIVKDENYSRQLFTQGAELGYKFSQFRLGSAFEYGMLGCPIDARQSIAWYTRAAAQGEHQSELALSGWYLTGSDGILQQSDTEAYLWARKAASSGLAKAEHAMGYFTEVGIGCAANLDEAKKWYWRASGECYSERYVICSG